MLLDSSCDFLRGVTVDSNLLVWLLTFAPTSDDGRPVLTNVVATLARFQADVDFSSFRFQGTASFSGATFESACRFVGAEFHRSATFRGARFLGHVDFSDTVIHADLNLAEAEFAKSLSWKAVYVGTSTNLTGVTAHERAQADIISRDKMVLHRSNWLGGVRLNVQCRQISLDGAAFGKPSLITEGDWWPSKLKPAHRQIPQLISTRDADLDNLTVADLDLSACRFNGAHNLDKLRIEGKWSSFARTPATFRWAKRIAIAEEHLWRAELGPWRNRKSWSRPDGESGEVPKPQQLAQIYRRLRKSREDAKDEPGAIDFYYGEMEMRRASARTRGFFNVEHLILSLYWLTSGYGTRAWRAFTGLLSIILVASVLFTIWGMPPGNGWPTGLRVALESATSLLRAPAGTFTAAGEWFVLVLRYLGPVLLALGALALRSRVKR